jgi:hypothetical protein
MTPTTRSAEEVWRRGGEKWADGETERNEWEQAWICAREEGCTVLQRGIGHLDGGGAESDAPLREAGFAWSLVEAESQPSTMQML